MPVPPLSQIEKTSGKLAESLAAGGTKTLLQVDGPPGAGKSVCLRSLAERLGKETDLKPIVVAPPSQHLDVGAVALADVAAGLGGHSLLNGELEAWIGAENVAAWSERVADVERWVGGNAQRVVLLFDDPGSWGSNRDEGDLFRQRGLTALAAQKIGVDNVSVLSIPGEKAKKASPQSVIRVLPDREWSAAGLSEMRSDRYLDSLAVDR